jgi:SPP1 family predicted phage head-tail adaptor
VITAGRRDKRVTLANPGGTVPDGEGGYVEGWVPLDPPEMLARINPASATDMERAAAGTQLVTAMHMIEMLYHPGVTVETRITYGARHFQVTSVRNPDEQNRELIIVAQELLT